MVEKRFELVLGVLMLMVVSALAGRGFETVLVDQAASGNTGFIMSGERTQLESTKEQEQITVVVDAGHGGVDPGKVSAEGVLEKNINLAIAQKLKVFLEAADVRVVLTRTDEAGLYGEKQGNKKIADMKERCRIIEESGAALVVSIHQNSYHDASVRGPQVFYYTHSETGRALAETIQASFTGLLGEGNRRTAKGNSDYYLLLHVAQPIVIVECGFLSCPEEAANLCDAAYQERVAWAIHIGILQHLNRASKA